MKIVIVAVSFANGARCPIAGQYLKSFDFDAFDGQGFGEFTNNKDEAMKFDSFIAAFEFWKTQSKKYPIRADGQPNRPLTSTTITFDRV